MLFRALAREGWGVLGKVLTELRNWLGKQRPIHELAAPNLWPWLPTARTGILARHPYCTDCGRIKHVGSGRALDAGGLANLISRLARFLREIGAKLTEAQARLILKELAARELTDPFSLSQEAQQGHLVSLLSASLGRPPEVVESYLHSC